jgi:hypothetical protein
VIGLQRRAEILDALRRGTVPREGLGTFAVGMERFEAALDADLSAVALGRGSFKAVRGEYGSGKTFFARWLQERARAALGFATSEVQVSETETPLHRWETIYRRLVERLATSETPDGALRSIVDAWFYTLETSGSDSMPARMAAGSKRSKRLQSVTRLPFDVRPEEAPFVRFRPPGGDDAPFLIVLVRVNDGDFPAIHQADRTRTSP